MPMSRILLLCLLSLELCFSAWWYSGCSRHGDVTDRQSVLRPEVEVVTPQRHAMTEYFELNGVTQFQKKDIIRATNTGYITALDFKPGDLIDTGKTFCLVETKEQHALHDLPRRDSILHRFQRALPVLSNAGGIVSTVNVLQGDYIAEGDVLASVCEPSSLIIVVNVPFEYHAKVQVGSACEVVLPDNSVLQVSMSGILPIVNATSQSQSFFIRVPGTRLPENLNVTVRLPLRSNTSALCVPTTAVLCDELQQHFWVMVVENDSVLRKVPIELGLQNAEESEIRTPEFVESRRVVSVGAFGLADSTIVHVRSVR